MAKKTKQAIETAQPSRRSYQIVGLELAPSMPIMFDGRTYDLANITEQEAAYLLKFPQQVPYLKSIQ